jgi:peptide/nickel transport system ATP-binding protein
MNNNDTLIRVENLTKHFPITRGLFQKQVGAVRAVDDVSFSIKHGETLGLVGESGCGKSTVASSVLRLLPPNGRITSGHIWFKGKDLSGATEDQMRHFRGLESSMIFQDPMTSLNPVFTIESQMADALRAHNNKLSRDEVHQRIVHMLDRVGIPDAADRIKSYPHEYSGGMRQRVMIAIALLANPSFMVADEPTSALDVTLEAQILDLIRGLREEYGTGILYISHDLGIMAQLCDRIIIMYAGNIVESGNVYEIFNHPKHPYTQALLNSHPSHKQNRERLTTIPGQVPSLRQLPPGCKFAPRCTMVKSVCQTIDPRFVQAGDRKVLCHIYDPQYAQYWSPSQFREPVVEHALEGKSQSADMIPPRASQIDEERFTLKIQDLKVHFQDRIGMVAQLLGQKRGVVRAVDGVDLEIRRGETLGLVGESGSGKTTLGRTILRLEDPTSGQTILLNEDITRLQESKVRPMRARMQMIFQDPISSLSPRLKVSTILTEPFRIHNIPFDPDTKVKELLQLVGLSPEQADKYPHELSGGQSRRVGIARALALNPEFLVADEPTAGLDVSVAASILNLLKDLRSQFDLTYLIITHNLNVISFIADRVGAMYLGRLVELGATCDIFDNPKHPYTEALISAISLPDPNLRQFQSQRIILKGEIPSPKNPPSGCHFHPRCRYAEEKCSRIAPVFELIDGGTHWTACHFPEKIEQRYPQHFAKEE